MNSKTKEYLADKFKQGKVTWDNGIFKLNKKDKVADEQGKLYQIMCSYRYQEPYKQFGTTISKFEKLDYNHIKYRINKLCCSVFLREIKP